MMLGTTAAPASGAPVILHVSADFPDLFATDKTGAIRALLELVGDRFDHRVVSLNRVTPTLADIGAALLGKAMPLDTAQSPGLTSLRYRALPKGLWHHHALRKLADVLLDQVLKGPRPDLIIAHKLTVEGIVVAHIARALGVPYAITIQGNTDAKILAARPDLAGCFAQILQEAAAVFPLAPWALHEVSQRLRVHPAQVITLPCPVLLDTPIPPKLNGQRLLTAFHLKNYKGKNLARLVDAFSRLRNRLPDLGLTLVGGGSPQDHAKVSAIIGKIRGIHLAGPIANAQMPAYFNRATGFAMPSLRESFGMVFIEALFCGAPVLYPAGRAIEGYFDGMDFAIPVDPKDTASIFDGLSRLVRDELRLKSLLATWQHSTEAARFTRESIARRYADGLWQALATPTACHSRALPPAPFLSQIA